MEDRYNRLQKVMVPTGEDGFRGFTDARRICSAEHLPVGFPVQSGGPVAEGFHGPYVGLGIDPIIDRLDRGEPHRIGHGQSVGLRIASDVLRLLVTDIDFDLHTPRQDGMGYERMYG